MYLVVPNDIKDIEIYKEHGIDTFILGLKDYSVNYPMVSSDKMIQMYLRIFIIKILFFILSNLLSK